MCGIWGLLRSNLTFDKQIVDACNKIKNRGPDTTIIQIMKNYIICFHRLAINDLSSRGNQPFVVSVDNYVYTLMINGEIYNHRELEKEYEIVTNTTSDCAIILPLFLKLNDNFIELNRLLRGEYGMIIIKENKIDNSIEYFISTDPLSVRPIFYFIDSDKYIVGVSSLLSGLSDFSNQVKRLDQGTYIMGKTDFKTYNDVLINKYHIINYDIMDLKIDQLYKTIIDTLRESVIVRLESDRPLGCLLSGGLDSSLIAALASKELSKSGKRLRTFSIGIEGGTDLEYAKIVANHINSDHTEFLFTPEEGLSVIDDVINATETYDITTIRASVGQFLIAKKISEMTDVKVLLNGDGADECQMGYIYFYLHPNIKDAYEERNRLIEQIHCYDGLRVDRNISYHGLEARVPFLDKEFVELYYRIDPKLLVPTKEHMEKYLIRKAFDTLEPELLPSEILWRKKEAFSDGVSSKEKSWYLIVKECYESKISDSEFVEREKLNGVIPHCKESFYYRKRFEELFNDNGNVIPGYWLPKWSNTKDPSARTLNIYV
jgi:asparagine synthase (glutamine-hydrolysing)